MSVNWVEYNVAAAVDETKGVPWAMRFDIRITGKATMMAMIRVDAPRYSLEKWLDLADGRADLSDDIRNCRVGTEDYLIIAQKCNGAIVHEVTVPRDMLAEKIRAALRVAVARRLPFAPVAPARWVPWAGLKGLVASAGRRACALIPESPRSYPRD